MTSPIEIDEVTPVEISDKDSTELTEQELSKVSGGLYSYCCSGKHYPEIRL